MCCDYCMDTEMNERIKQLWEEAAKKTQGDSWEEQTKFIEKFAELIVRECALVVHKKTGPKSAWDVLQHFGVEE